jgi:hypothetical protein
MTWQVKDRLRRYGCSLALALLLLTPALTITASAYNPLGDACHGKAAKSAACQDNRSTGGTNNSNPLLGKNGVLTNIIKIVILVSGVAAVIIIIIAGFKFMGASDPQSAAGARSTLLNAVIGLIVVVLSYSIIGLVTGSL